MWCSHFLSSSEVKHEVYVRLVLERAKSCFGPAECSFFTSTAALRVVCGDLDARESARMALQGAGSTSDDAWGPYRDLVEKEVRTTVSAFGQMRDVVDSFSMLQGFKVDQLKRCASLLFVSKNGNKSKLQENCMERVRSCRNVHDTLADDIVLCVHLEGRPTKPDFRADVSLLSVPASTTQIRRVIQTARFPEHLRSNNIHSSSNNDNNDDNNGDDDKGFRCLCGGGRGRMPVITCTLCRSEVHPTCYAVRPNTTGFVCEMCRTKYSDPFWRSVGTVPSRSLLLKASRWSQCRSYMTANQVGGEKSFALRRDDVLELRKKKKAFTISCHLLVDTVLYRNHWPPSTMVTVNGRRFRPTDRGYNQKLGKKSCEKRLDISEALHEGHNNLSISGQDYRLYVVVFQFAQRLESMQVVEKVRESFEKRAVRAADENLKAEARARSICSGKGGDDVVALSLRVSLRCPLGGVIVKDPARFTSCKHIACFDLECFLQMCSQTGKLQCPICMNIEPYADLRIDWYLNTVLKQLYACGLSDVSEVEVDPSGKWRVPEGRYRQKDWHSICLEGPPEFLDNEVMDLDVKQEQKDSGQHDMELSELEELRQAAAACAECTKQGDYKNGKQDLGMGPDSRLGQKRQIVIVESDDEQDSGYAHQSAMDRSAALALMASMRSHHSEQDCQSFLGLIDRSLPRDGYTDEDMLSLLTNRHMRTRGPLDSFVTQNQSKRPCVSSGRSEGQSCQTLDGVPVIEID